MNPTPPPDGLVQGARDFLRKGDAPGDKAPPEIQAAMADPQRRLDHYVLLAEIGRGGMGHVWKAWDLRLGRWVAVKLLREGVQDLARKRFLREAQAAAGLRHFNLVTIHDFGDREGRLYIVMEFIEGRPLDFTRPLRETVLLLRQVAQGLEAAHRAGVVHRDLKPGNIMVDAQGSPRVVDFGLAQLDESSKLTQVGNVIGTPMYMAPEQVLGKLDQIGPRTDVYALGTILYEAMAHRPVFSGANAAELFQKILNVEPITPEGPPDLVSICLKALEKTPERRYADAGEFGRDLDAWLKGDPVKARPPSRVRTLIRGVARRRVALMVAAFAVLLPVAIWSTLEIRKVRAERRLEDLVRPLEARIAGIQKDLYIRGSEIHAELSSLSKDLLELEKRLIDPELARRPEPWILLGTGWYLVGNLEAAEKSLLRATEIAPGDSRAAYQLGRVYLDAASLCLTDYGIEAYEQQRNRYLELIVKAKKWLDRPLRPGRATEIELALMKAYASYSRSTPECVQNCRDALVRFGPVPGTEEFHALLGMLEPDGGFDHFTRALEIRPNHVFGLFRRAVARFMKDPNGALVDIEDALRLNPEFVEAHLLRGQVHLGRKDYERAREDNSQALKRLDPRDSRCFIALLNRAYSLEKLGLSEENLADLNAAIRLVPTQPGPYFNRGNLLVKRGDHEGAVSDYNTEIGLDPKHTDAYSMRGAARWKLNEREEAIRDFLKAVEIEPGHLTAATNLCFVVARISEENRVGPECLMLRSVLPGLDVAIPLHAGWGEGYFYRGLARHTLGKETLMRGPGRIGVADAEQSLPDLAAAKSDYDTALKFGYGQALANRAETHRIRAEAEWVLGRDPRDEYRLSIEDNTEYLKTHPRLPSILSNRGAARLGMGRWLLFTHADPRPVLLEAQEDAKAALEIEPGSSNAAQILEQIGRLLR